MFFEEQVHKYASCFCFAFEVLIHDTELDVSKPNIYIINIPIMNTIKTQVQCIASLACGGCKWYVGFGFAHRGAFKRTALANDPQHSTKAKTWAKDEDSRSAKLKCSMVENHDQTNISVT